jgi:thiol-disulfide isomerase/thioredoxin
MKTLRLTLLILLFSNFLIAQNSGTNIGNKAIDLSYNNPNGEKMSLSKIKDKLVLIDFWASWCGPCRRENPNLVDAYRKYNKTKFKDGNGFEIYSLSLDKNEDAWVKAINQDQLFWEYHVSDLGGWQSEGSNKTKFNLFGMMCAFGACTAPALAVPVEAADASSISGFSVSFSGGG